MTSLTQRAARDFAITFLFLSLLIFLSAGSLRYWQAWVYLGLIAGFWTIFLTNFLKHDPALLERRLQRRENEPEQRLFQRLFMLMIILAYILPGLDFRFGWSRTRLGGVPLALVVTGEVLVATGSVFIFWVMKTNTFAASTIQVETGQRVIDNGPYAAIRHPMYTGMLVWALGTPLALGSYVALPVFAMLIPGLAFRLVNEEHVLRRDLPGYIEYCQRVRFRLIPGVW
jgi:protein-S-isoprenylcysteine O-methyltransferase Ste14